jgi:hypothetical protein
MPLESHGLRSPNDDASEVLADGDLAGVAATAYVGLEQGRAGGVSRGRDQVGEDEMAHACLFCQPADGDGVGVVAEDGLERRAGDLAGQGGGAAGFVDQDVGAGRQVGDLVAEMVSPEMTTVASGVATR